MSIILTIAGATILWLLIAAALFEFWVYPRYSQRRPSTIELIIISPYVLIASKLRHSKGH